MTADKLFGMPRRNRVCTFIHIRDENGLGKPCILSGFERNDITLQGQLPGTLIRHSNRRNVI